MAKENPSPPRDETHPEQQDQSIKARKSSLFEVHDEVIGSTRPFKDYVKTVPAEPMSPMVKMALIVTTVVAVLLLFGALLSVARGRRPRATSKTEAGSSRVETFLGFRVHTVT